MSLHDLYLRCSTEEPSRELDNAIWCEIGDTHAVSVEEASRHRLPFAPSTIFTGRSMSDAMKTVPQDQEGIGRAWNVPRFTTSLDAVEALIKPEQPFVYTVLTDFGGLYRARVTDAIDVFTTSDGHNSAMALMGAYLHALSIKSR